VSIDFFYDAVKFRLKESGRLKEWIQKVFSHYNKKAGNLIIVFVDKQHIQEINQKFLGHFYPTDIITFNENEGNIIGGELYICPEIVKENASTYGEYFYMEIRRVIIHGILHLIGHDDSSAEEADEMRALENHALSIFPT
jgi:rRNA maturation RNase YbeY